MQGGQEWGGCAQADTDWTTLQPLAGKPHQAEGLCVGLGCVVAWVWGAPVRVLTGCVLATYRADGVKQTPRAVHSCVGCRRVWAAVQLLADKRCEATGWYVHSCVGCRQVWATAQLLADKRCEANGQRVHSCAGFCARAVPQCSCWLTVCHAPSVTPAAMSHLVQQQHVARAAAVVPLGRSSLTVQTGL